MIIQRLAKNHFAKIRTIDVYSPDAVEKYWRCVRDDISELKMNLLLGDIGVYGLDYYNQKSSDLKLCASTLLSDVPEDKNIISIEKIITYEQPAILTQTDVESYAFGTYILIPGVRRDYAIVIGVNVESGGEMHNAISGLVELGYTFAGSLAMVYSLIAERTSALLFRVYRHEMAHLLLGLDSLGIKEFEYPEQRNDYISIMRQIRVLSDNMKLLVGAKTLNEETFLVYTDVLSKWAHMLDQSFNEKSLHLRLERQDFSNSISVHADKSAFDQIVSNLLDNAYKYAHYGSIIDVDFCIDETGKRKLWIIDYGQSVTDEGNIYELYFRGSNSWNVEGSGIGLFIVSEIAKLYSGKVCHSCCHISEFNIPMIHYYLELYKENCDGALYQKLRCEYDRLVNNGIYREIVNNKCDRMPPRQRIEETIMQPTYKVIFEVIF